MSDDEDDDFFADSGGDTDDLIAESKKDSKPIAQPKKLKEAAPTNKKRKRAEKIPDADNDSDDDGTGSLDSDDEDDEPKKPIIILSEWINPPDQGGIDWNREDLLDSFAHRGPGKLHHPFHPDYFQFQDIYTVDTQDPLPPPHQKLSLETYRRIHSILDEFVATVSQLVWTEEQVADRAIGSIHRWNAFEKKELKGRIQCWQDDLPDYQHPICCAEVPGHTLVMGTPYHDRWLCVDTYQFWLNSPDEWGEMSSIFELKQQSSPQHVAQAMHNFCFHPRHGRLRQYLPLPMYQEFYKYPEEEQAALARIDDDKEEGKIPSDRRSEEL